MVNNAALDLVFGALADPTRRRIMERLARGEHSAGELAEGFAMSQPAISKHLRVLERSGLLERTIVGRVHRCRLAPEGLESAREWVERQERFWNESLDRLDDYLSQTSKGKKKK